MKDPWINQDPGWVEGFGFDEEGARSIRASATGCTSALRAAMLTARRAREIGIPRAYGYGATMGAWATDYLAFWAGNDGMVRHSKMPFRRPSFEGDVTYVTGKSSPRKRSPRGVCRSSQSRCDDQSGRSCWLTVFGRGGVAS